MMQMLTLEFLDGEGEVETVVEAEEDCAEVGEGEEEVVEVMDYNLDQHVLRHIKEKENGKKQSSQVSQITKFFLTGLTLQLYNVSSRRKYIICAILNIHTFCIVNNLSI